MKPFHGQSAANGGLMGSAMVFGVLVNLLTLTGPLFMLQVYDRVLGSRSPETLTALFLLVVFLYLMMAVLDFARGRVILRAGLRQQVQVEDRVFTAFAQPQAANANLLRDLDALQTYHASPAPRALMDVPWAPVFLAAIFLFHPWLGVLALVGGTCLLALSLAGQVLNRDRAQQALGLTELSHRLAAEVRGASDLVRGQAMLAPLTRRWLALRHAALAPAVQAADSRGNLASLAKSLRLLMQSAMLALGALLVLRGQLTGGAMIASSILLGRAMSPVETLLAQWPLIQRARASHRAIAAALAAQPAPQHRTQLPAPDGRLELRAVSVAPPGHGKPTLNGLTFKLEPGQALGVIGLSGAGKSTLARGLAGIWPVTGQITLGGVPIERFASADLGNYVGYLPQGVSLFTGTVAENIARMSDAPDTERVLAAAKLADVHDLILSLPQGYDTPIDPANPPLSGGQYQRLALARALYSDPILLVLDEPNSALDSDGSTALNACIRTLKARGTTVVVMSHRPAAISECDLLMILDAGHATALGPRDAILKHLMNGAQVLRESPSLGATG